MTNSLQIWENIQKWNFQILRHILPPKTVSEKAISSQPTKPEIWDSTCYLDPSHHLHTGLKAWPYTRPSSYPHGHLTCSLLMALDGLQVLPGSIPPGPLNLSVADLLLALQIVCAMCYSEHVDLTHFCNSHPPGGGEAVFLPTS